MKQFLIFILSVSVLSWVISCQNSTNEKSSRSSKQYYRDSLRQLTTRVEVGFFSDYSKSSIEFSDGGVSRSTYIDSICNCIGDRMEMRCSLRQLFPDGTISFYNKDSLITSLYFVLNDPCRGFYDDFTDKSNMYVFIANANQVLFQLKRNILPR